jgi:hypothetical protein
MARILVNASAAAALAAAAAVACAEPSRKMGEQATVVITGPGGAA